VIEGLLMIAGGAAAGLFGSLLGLGGGILIVPLLTLVFGLDVRQAVGVSLVAVIVTSGASAAVFLQRHVANLRLGMTLELFTAIGALIGGLVAFLLSDRVLAGLFAALLVYTAATMVRRGTAVEAAPPDEPDVPDTAEVPPFSASLGGPGYAIRSFGFGAAGSVGAGIVSALLGVGGGLVKVPVMHVVMGVPLRVATATSNLMIGVTASASAVIYLLRGEIDPFVAGPIAIGAFVGASAGSRTAHRIDLRLLRILFVVVLLYTAVQMVRRAVGG
jgi:uncharacterized membrane protein YfcA